MNQNEFAERVGVSRGAVSHALKIGRIHKNSDGELDEQAIEDWTANRDDYKDQSIGTDEAKGLAGQRTKKEKFNALLKELEYKKEIGKVIDRNDVEKELFAYTRYLRDGIMTIPDRVSAKVSAAIIRAMLKKFTKEERKLISDKINDVNLISAAIHEAWKAESKELLEALSDGVKI